MERNDALQLVVNYIEESGGEFEGLTSEKIWGRSELIPDSDKPDWIVFEVERHRGILGTLYAEGEPMEAFVTFWPRYAFQSETKQFEQLGEYRKPEVTIDYKKVAGYIIDRDGISLSFAPFDTDLHLCRDDISNEECLVNSVEDVQVFAVKLVDAWATSYEEELGWYMEPQEVKKSLVELQKALDEAAISEARMAWQIYQDEGPEC